jgi:type I restriction enzyme R subunit
MGIQHEATFEDELVEHLAAHGWEYSPNDDGYDKARALFPADVFAWLTETQAGELAKIVKPEASAAQQETVRGQLLDRIAQSQSADPMNGGGTLNALKKPIGLANAKFSLFQARPATTLNPTLGERYTANRLRVMRQVEYSAKNGNRIDLVLFVNGIAVATIELKTDLTQSAQAGLKQYAQDRVPTGEPLLEFGRGALVHFVVSNELVYMATKLDGANTRFLPFNRGKGNGAGNDPIPGTSPTAYFWTETLSRDAWLDLIGRFLHYRFEEKRDPISSTKSYDRSLRFPRYHQWRAVTKLERAVLDEGVGQNYLIQHSAGSGKTDSIAWTAHRLANLHGPDEQKVFDGVIVVSDRQVLDGQLQRAVEQLQTTPGVFQPITKGADDSKSKQLAEALLARKQIIGVTLQTFPHALSVIEANEGLRGRKYAVIADEAHSSQSGEAAASLKQLLTAGKAGAGGSVLADAASALAPTETVDGDAGGIDTEDVLADLMARKVGIGTISFFAFTATPKGKTVDLFGRADESGVKREFDLYSMKQAIEEGFILDVLKNYLPYDLAFTIAQAGETDVQVDVSKANSEAMRWVRLHPFNIAQKVAVIVEHFRANVRSELGGRAKAMVVTGSRKEAVRYKLAIDKYIVDHHLQGQLGALVAFSGGVTDSDSGPEEFNESNMNPALNGRALEDAFKGDEFQVMIVANKFQTGFDQPLLVGMYVDKKLSGITAVQTLSRLNRVIPGKENTYVIDFVNDPAEILAAFQTYYEDAVLQTESDPNVIHDMLGKLQAIGIVDQHDIEGVVDAWLNKTSHNKLYSHVATSRDRFWTRWHEAVEVADELELGRLEEFRGTVSAFVRAYDFFSQILDYGDTDIEKWAIFLRVYRRVIEHDDPRAPTISADDIVLTHYRLRKLETASLGLTSGTPGELSGITAAGSGAPQETKYGLLQEVIDKINTLFTGSGIDEVDAVSVTETVLRHIVENESIQAEAMANTSADFHSSPTIPAELENAIYESGIGHNAGIKALLQMGDLGPLVNVLIAMGLYEKSRVAAASE